LLTDVAVGAASGALAATGVGLIGQIAGNAAISMAGNATDQVIKNKGFRNFDARSMVVDGANGVGINHTIRSWCWLLICSPSQVVILWKYS